MNNNTEKTAVIVLGSNMGNRLEMLRLLPTLSSGKRIDHPAAVQYQAREIRLTAPGAPATADGDPAGLLPAHFRAARGALDVLVP